jgi:CubicO group peptidase (beta-lactamase class C family)
MMLSLAKPLRLIPGFLLTLWALYVCANEIPTPDTDPVMARNMQAMMAMPGVMDLSWHQPLASVKGGRAAPADLREDWYPAPDAIRSVRRYSDAHGGLGLLVWYNGHLVDRHFADAVTETTAFTAYSMHKSVLAIAILAAVEDDIIENLDVPVGRYLKTWQNDKRGEITLRQFLQQSSGLAHPSYRDPGSIAAALALSSAISETALKYPLEYPPGTRFDYNNVNAQIAGSVLEEALRLTGRSYPQYLSDRIWQPLGNNDANLFLEDEGGSPRYFAGLDAGLADWLRVGITLTGEGPQVLTPQSRRILSTPSDLNAGYGINVWLAGNWQPKRSYGPTSDVGVAHAEPFLAPDVLFFDGFGGQRVYVVPSSKLVVARFGNVDMAFDDSVIVNTLLRGLMTSDKQDLAETH